MHDLGSPGHPGSHVQVAGDPRRSPREVRIAESDVLTLLSPSELIVLCAAANGLTAAETATKLGKGTQTVKTQRGQALLKLGARNTAQAVSIATECGILTTAPLAGIALAA